MKSKGLRSRRRRNQLLKTGRRRRKQVSPKRRSPAKRAAFQITRVPSRLHQILSSLPPRGASSAFRPHLWLPRTVWPGLPQPFSTGRRAPQAEWKTCFKRTTTWRFALPIGVPRQRWRERPRSEIQGLTPRIRASP